MAVAPPSIALFNDSLSNFPQSLSISAPVRRQRDVIVFGIEVCRPPLARLQASRRASNFSQGSESLGDNSRQWNRDRRNIVIGGEYDDDGVDEEEDEDEEEDRSLDLLVRFLENVFKKISRKARKAVRSVLPLNISTNLVEFSVNGVMILAFLWVLKAFLEVVCTLGSVVFASILLIRGIWTGVTYLQESRGRRTNNLDDLWSGAQPVT